MTISPSRLVLLATLAAVVPAGVAAQQPAIHTVKRGDTLWDLAQRYLGDPFLWPQIYRLNTSVVEDPHWIYPGEVLRLVGGEGVQAVPSEETPAAPRPVAQEGEYPMPEFAQRRPSAQFESLQAYTEQAYRPLRPGAFYSAPWLSEQQQLPSGRFLGQVTPPQIIQMIIIIIRMSNDFLKKFISPRALPYRAEGQRAGARPINVHNYQMFI